MRLEEKIVNEALRQVKAHLETGDWEGAIAVLESLRPPDQADVFTGLPRKDQERLLPRMDVEDSADIMEQLEDEDAVELASRLKVENLARILDEMEPDDAADLIGDLSPERAAEAIAAMKEPEDILPLLQYPDETAGGRMTPLPITLNAKMTVEEALNYVRLYAPDSDIIYYLFVVDDEGKLVGVVSLRQLLVASPYELVENIMDRDVIYVHHFTDQEECARLISRYDLLALPVVDDEMHLLGMITVDDLMDVMEEEATEDIHRLAGSEPLKEPYLTAKVFSIVRKRIGWLLLLFLAELYTGTVLRHFHRELSQAIALSYFIPLLIGTGGNAGSQAATTVIRAMALKEVKFRDAPKVLFKEISLGFLLGLVIGIVGFIRAISWGSEIALSITVGVTMATIIVWANIVGSFLPMLAARLGLDPAVLSAPFVTTLVDGTGLFIYLSIAKIILGL
ncbi:MAG: magnesium transporter [Chloroflexi bacterium]|nr:MAG: magnesium transporter [Chloroflexota bacterium]HDN79984.1 magnesium transporter [Chloroflexota bacterium]